MKPRALEEEIPSLALEDMTPTRTVEVQVSKARDLQGGQVFGRFRLLMEMGVGGMAALFLARIRGPKQFEKMVAIKRIHDHLTRNDEFVDMFLDEARIAALVHHPNVVNTFDLGTIQGSYFIAMEYVHGQTLLDLYKTSKRLQVPLPWGHAARIVADAAAGLHAAHELKDSDGKPLGVVHRDVSPQNILISYEGHVKVVDFGIAYATEKLSHTKTGTVRGKIAYMSPEQTRRDSLDRRSDVFSLGIVLYELTCMRRLFKTSSESDSLRLVRAAHVEHRPRELSHEIPAVLEEIIMKCLARYPEDRYATAEKLSEALETLLVADGQVVSPQTLAKYMDRMFHDQHKLKDAQIQNAVKSITHGGLPSVGMIGETSSGIDLTSSEQTQPTQPLPRSKGLRVPGLVLAGTALAAIALAALFGLGPFSPERGTSPGTSQSAATAPPAIANLSTVSLLIKVQPANNKVQIAFRGRTYRGSTLKLVVVRSEKMEHLTVTAPGYQTENLLVVPATDKEIPVNLAAMSQAATTAQPPRTAPHSRPRPKGPGRSEKQRPHATNTQPRQPQMRGTTPPKRKEPVEGKTNPKDKPKDLSAPFEW
jgi:eukaryotic-like serine/threonine-protein kinase